MSVLAFKALSYGAEQIPDKFFEKIPGGFFTPQETKDIKQGRKNRKDDKTRERRQSEGRSKRRTSRRDRSPSTESSEHSEFDDHTDDERERAERTRERRRARSTARAPSRSLSRGRDDRRSRALDGEYSDPRVMAQTESGAHYFPPPPTSEYEAYSPQEYPSAPAQNAPAVPAYGYSPQSAAPQAYPHAQSSGQREGPRCAASRYTPGPGYAPSPPVNAVFPPAPIGTISTPYSPYRPSDYPPGHGDFAGNTYPSPPPFGRQRSSSQPLYVPSNIPPYPTYIPPSADQHALVAYDQPHSRHGSAQARREERHRARSADSPSRSHQDGRRDRSRMTKVRERLDGIDLREKGLAATVGGALAGGLAGRQMGKSRLTTLVGAAAGALGGRTMADKRSKSRGERRSRSGSRSRSRPRARNHNGEGSKDTGLGARSRSVIHRFRSTSRGHDERDSRADRRDRHPDRGYDRGGDEHEYLRSESEGDGSSVPSRRRRRRRRD